MRGTACFERLWLRKLTVSLFRFLSVRPTSANVLGAPWPHLLAAEQRSHTILLFLPSFAPMMANGRAIGFFVTHAFAALRASSRVNRAMPHRRSQRGATNSAAAQRLQIREQILSRHERHQHP